MVNQAQPDQFDDLIAPVTETIYANILPSALIVYLKLNLMSAPQRWLKMNLSVISVPHNRYLFSVLHHVSLFST
jgi:hypothetical protein